MSTDRKKYNPNNRPRLKLQTQGANSVIDNYLQPEEIAARIRTYQKMSYFEPVITVSLEFLLNLLIGSLEPITHPNPDVTEYLRENIDRMKSIHLCNFNQQLYHMVRNTIVNGFVIAEKIFEIDEDKNLYLKGFSIRNPCSIRIRLDKNGDITEGAPALHEPLKKSGVFQVVPEEVKERTLSLWKHIYLVNHKERCKHIGVSELEACYRWHITKNAIHDMQLEGLEQQSNPITFLLLPDFPTKHIEENPETGERINVKSIDWIRNQLNEGKTMIEIPFTEKEFKPEVITITRPIEALDSYLQGIRFAELQMTRTLKIPYAVVSSVLFNEHLELTERDIEILNERLDYLYQELVEPLIAQAFYQIISDVFGKEEAKKIPQMKLRKMTRPEDRTSLVQLITGLTNQGYLNPTDVGDWQAVRQLADVPDRSQEAKDIEFVKQLLVYPRQPKETVAPGKPSKPKPTTGAAKVEQPKDDPLNSASTRDRSSEGQVNGKGKPGRPVAKTNPLAPPR